MPWITVNLLEGHSAEKKQRLHQEVAQAVQRSLDIPVEWIKIQIIEMKEQDHSIGGVTLDKSGM
jgi:4-oxalocrotonate tautomerase